MLTQWIQKIISMLLVMSAVLQVIPGKDYEKYIRFFCGLVLIVQYCLGTGDRTCDSNALQI